MNLRALGAAAQTYAATSKEIPENSVHGRMFVPSRWLGVTFAGVGTHNFDNKYEDPAEWKKLWDHTEEAVAKELAK